MIFGWDEKKSELIIKAESKIDAFRLGVVSQRVKKYTQRFYLQGDQIELILNPKDIVKTLESDR